MSLKPASVALSGASNARASGEARGDAGLLATEAGLDFRFLETPVTSTTVAVSEGISACWRGRASCEEEVGVEDELDIAMMRGDVEAAGWSELGINEELSLEESMRVVVRNIQW